MGYGGDVAEQKNKHMNLLDNIQIQVEEIKKFNELNGIQKSRKLKHIRTLGKMTKEDKDKRKRVRKIKNQKFVKPLEVTSHTLLVNYGKKEKTNIIRNTVNNVLAVKVQGLYSYITKYIQVSMVMNQITT